MENTISLLSVEIGPEESLLWTVLVNGAKAAVWKVEVELCNIGFV